MSLESFVLCPTMLSNSDTKAGAEFSKQLLFKLLPDCFRFIIAGGGNEHILFKYIGNCVYSSIICNFISCNLSHLSDLLLNVDGENTILGFFLSIASYQYFVKF